MARLSRAMPQRFLRDPAAALRCCWVAYQLRNPFLRLWFGCIAPFESLLEFGRGDAALPLIRERLARHQAWAFERICREIVEDHAPELGLVRVGRHWDKAVELDVVGLGEGGVVAFVGECIWSPYPIGGDALETRLSAARWQCLVRQSGDRLASRSSPASGSLLPWPEGQPPVGSSSWTVATSFGVDCAAELFAAQLGPLQPLSEREECAT